MAPRIQIPTATPEMFPGIVGELVHATDPVTEASPAAVASQFLVAVGNAVGRTPHFYVGQTRHALNENVLLVGRSAFARKGDAGNAALHAIGEADPEWFASVASGLSSGEGLIHAVRDPVVGQDKDGHEVVRDPGIADKRLLVLETEFSQPLKMFRREGNILSNTVRDAWDGKSVLRTLTKTQPVRATDAHISIIGHTTPEDLRAYMGDVEIANGLGNRFLFVLVDRAKLVPNPPRMSPTTSAQLVHKLREILDFGGRIGAIQRSSDAARLWERIYPDLTGHRPGLLGKLLGRGPAHVARLSKLFALLAQAQEEAPPHLEAALAWWDYCVDSVEIIFADRTGNDVADRIRAEMLPGQALTLSEIREQIFAGHVTAGRLSDGLGLLQELAEVRLEPRATGGRSATVVVRLNGAEAHA